LKGPNQRASWAASDKDGGMGGIVAFNPVLIIFSGVNREGLSLQAAGEKPAVRQNALREATLPRR
jgi:hypothetical protein